MVYNYRIIQTQYRIKHIKYSKKMKYRLKKIRKQLLFKLTYDIKRTEFYCIVSYLNQWCVTFYGRRRFNIFFFFFSATVNQRKYIQIIRYKLKKFYLIISFILFLTNSHRRRKAYLHTYHLRIMKFHM